MFTNDTLQIPLLFFIVGVKAIVRQLSIDFIYPRRPASLYTSSPSRFTLYQEKLLVFDFDHIDCVVMYNVNEVIGSLLMRSFFGFEAI